MTVKQQCTGLSIGCVFAVVIALKVSAGETAPQIVNSVGMRMIRIEPGTFQMGNKALVPEELKGPLHSPTGDWDERPVHRVTISRAFYISEAEVTVEQFRRFDSSFSGNPRDLPFAAGLSWNEAAAFCTWLSREEKKPYRLPTEAEWEYAARAGTQSLFWSGSHLLANDARSPWKLLGIHSGPLEWVADWYGEYPPDDQTDPVGPASGIARVARGGGIQEVPAQHGVSGLNPYYRRSANRASMIPDYRGQHHIGFRVVLGKTPRTKAWPVEAPFPEQAVKTSEEMVGLGPAPDKPYYHLREILPIPPEDSPADTIEAAGLPEAVMGHNHSPGLAVCPNGDVIAIYFSASTSSSEYLPNVNFVFSRLRYGSEEWDMPALFYDLADVNEQGSVLWVEGNRLWHFSGGQGLPDVPLRIQTSNDNGATWTPLRFAFFPKAPANYAPQPITSAFRGSDGAIYVGSDGVGGQSLLWSSPDNGQTWRDTGGRTYGRHTAFVQARDGRFLGYGGKNTSLGGYMPLAISNDHGRSWMEATTPFPALGSNQRPTVIRLTSGHLFAAGDYQDFQGRAPAAIADRGSWVALSEDDGKTWKIKPLPGARPHESHVIHREFGDANWVYSPNLYATLGYAVARQAPNGVIHLISTMNHPGLHFEMNEAWILDSHAGIGNAAEMTRKAPPTYAKELYSNGNTRAEWSGTIANDGRYLLDGSSRFYYENGSRQYETRFVLGRKIGVETYWSRNGSVLWTREYFNEHSVWTQFWNNGKKKSQSEWKGLTCDGTGRKWDRSGRLVWEGHFADGELLGQ
jgi:formylglycine-generating enzyme required for sulfatase activity